MSRPTITTFFPNKERLIAKLDDTKDADSTNKGQNVVTQPKARPKANYQYKLSDLKKMVANKEMSSDRANELCKQGKVNMNA